MHLVNRLEFDGRLFHRVRRGARRAASPPPTGPIGGGPQSCPGPPAAILPNSEPAKSALIRISAGPEVNVAHCGPPFPPPSADHPSGLAHANVPSRALYSPYPVGTTTDPEQPTCRLAPPTISSSPPGPQTVRSVL